MGRTCVCVCVCWESVHAYITTCVVHALWQHTCISGAPPLCRPCSAMRPRQYSASAMPASAAMVIQSAAMAAFAAMPIPNNNSNPSVSAEAASPFSAAAWYFAMCCGVAHCSKLAGGCRSAGVGDAVRGCPPPPLLRCSSMASRNNHSASSKSTHMVLMDVAMALLLCNKGLVFRSLWADRKVLCDEVVGDGVVVYGAVLEMAS